MGSEQGTPDFEALARQYWTAWGDLLRERGGSGVPVDAGLKAWQQGLAEWGRLAHGARADADAAVGRFTGQAHEWYARMQQVAAQLAGQPGVGAPQVAEAWRRALGAAGDNPFPELFRHLRGQGRDGLSQWIEDATPWLESVRGEAASWLGMPAFGFTREHQERWQRLARAHLDYQQRLGAWNGLMGRAGQAALEGFEQLLERRAREGRLPDTARGLFDLWIDAAEQAWADIALSPEFREVHGALVDAQMRLRGALQREAEQVAAQLGMPTRTEVDAAHRKIVELQRELRQLRDQVAAGAPGARTAAGSAPSASAGPGKGAATGRQAKPKTPARPAPAKARRPAAPAAKQPAPARGRKQASPARDAARRARQAAAPARAADSRVKKKASPVAAAVREAAPAKAGSARNAGRRR
jgi:polyhydroxyalkanoate synthase subunit PhaE